ncbi:mannose-6-phosphate isomerase, class I [Polaribacter aquimarinus]|uniref:mannose-6-phosphate isomerase n=1 Tax=Polaribacter aquimarinus TaxID=2100726 RepID=A0A2U2JEM3_9FLAO|nr:mannose-6-phosphate isomerase, class I [Polaribacter aquimarinus]PWG06797.1 mannose-6-phosphate isomerase, class I [Polaribacter aquimarinus]
MNTATLSPKLLPIIGKTQNYAWGGKNYISELLKIKSNHQKCAEYWLGAHTSAPSFISTLKGNIPLDTYLKNNLFESLGKETLHKFGKLPFLFKVLDVKEMLSIQVHPTKKAAEIGFKLENDLGIPLNAPYRNYKDDNHKPEIMVALSEFWLLHGFLPKDKLEKVLKNTKELASLMPIFIKDGYLGLYKKVMSFSKEEIYKILNPLTQRIMPLYWAGKLEKNSPDYWAAKAVASSAEKNNLDKGIFSIYFFNLVQLQKGEAIFQDAGVPHAYLEGQNIELMANSDNVLRGGLTQKHIDVNELLKHISFKATIPNILNGEKQKDNLERIFLTPVKDFELSEIKIPISKVYKSVSKTPQILLLLKGEVEIRDKNNSLKLTKGQSVFLKANCDYEIVSLKNAIVYKAKVGN